MERRSKILLYKWVKPHYHVVAVVSFVIISMILAYIISVTSEHVSAVFPYISDTGTKAPASCVFGLFLNLASVFGFTTMLIRHRYFEKYNGIDTHHIHVVNDITLFIGSLSILGIMLVANFQETSQLTVHLIGAIMAFGLGLLYCAFQCYLTYKTIPFGLSKKLVFIIRLVLVGIACCGFIGTFSGASVVQKEMSKMNSTEHQGRIKLHWKSTDPGYSAHLVSTFSEWIMVLSFIFFFATYFNEFKYIKTCINLECFEFVGDRTRLGFASNMLETSSSNREREPVVSAIRT